MTEPAPTGGFWSVAATDPDRPAVIGPDGAVTTFGELRDASEAAARGLRALGLDRGDSLAVVVPNTRDWFVAHLAGMRAGLYVVPVNTHLAAPEVTHVVVDSDAAAVIADASLVELCRPALDASGLPESRCFATSEAAGLRPLDDLLAVGRAAPELPRGIGAGTTMMYTSGTTGRPKGVRRPLPEGEADLVLGRAAHLYCSGFGVEPGPAAHLVCGPLYHAGPSSSATSSLHAGNTLVLMDRWEPELCLELIERHRVASTQMVPTMFHRLLALPPEVRARYDVSSVTSVMHTGAPCPVGVKTRFMEWFGPVVYETYGGTESVATIATPRRWLQKPGTVGRPIHGVTVHIVGDDGEELPPGATGTIYIENRNAPIAEYFKDPEKTSRMRRGDWVTLGDVGLLDEDGFLFLRDRSVDMIISAGVNIYPAEVEGALLECPLVGDAAVIGVPDEDRGESVMAIVELADGVDPGEATTAAILDHCRERIARFKVPRRVEVVDRLPRLPSGKLQKRLLRAPYWEGQDRMI
jgi:long-chain acyl-CoA synthetase